MTATCRVAVLIDDHTVDVSLPTDIPIHALIPTLGRFVTPQPQAPTMPRARFLSSPGSPPFDSERTLGELGIREGSTLILGCDAAAPPLVRHYDAAATIGTVDPRWTAHWSRIAALLTMVALTALAGFFLVPGPAVTPGVLLASSAGATAALIAALFGRSGPDPFATIAVVGGLVATTALLATLADASAATAGVGLVVGAVVLLTVSGRVAVTMAGPIANPHRLLACVDGAAAAAATLGGFVAALCHRHMHWAVVGFVGSVAIALSLRSRRCSQPVNRAVMSVAGFCCGTAALLHVQLTAAPPPLWMCVAAAIPASVAAWCGFGSPPLLAPALRRCVDAVEFAAPALSLPLAAWAMGGYDLARGLVS